MTRRMLSSAVRGAEDATRVCPYRAAESALKIRSDIAHLAGDTLFVGGCGRFFEGSAADAYNTMRHVCFTMNQLASMPVALTGMI